MPYSVGLLIGEGPRLPRHIGIHFCTVVVDSWIALRNLSLKPCSIELFCWQEEAKAKKNYQALAARLKKTEALLTASADSR